jgi:serpin B
MRTTVPVLLIALAGCGKSTTPDDDPPPPPPWSAEMQAVADGGNRFALDLYGQLREKPGNLFFSPYSVHGALAMTADGANDTTRDQMVKVLHLPADQDQALAVGDLGPYYTARSGSYELSVANRLWGQTGYPWRPEFLDRQKQRFGAGFEEADFQADPDAVRRRVNGWVEEKTAGRVRDLFLQPDITTNARMVLANAVYFKAKWADAFKPDHTRDADFRLADGGTVSVPLMFRGGKYRYADPAGFQVLELPYRARDLALVVILPREPNGLPAIEHRLTAENLTAWLGGLGSTDDVQVYLPRFKLEYRFELPDNLRALGMTDPFDPARADFSGMAPVQPDGRLFLSAAVHKAFVAVDEAGTEAVAATGVTVSVATARDRREPVVFRADRPFLFLIRDVKHGTVLFLGRLTDPTK